METTKRTKQPAGTTPRKGDRLVLKGGIRLDVVRTRTGIVWTIPVDRPLPITGASRRPLEALDVIGVWR